MDWKKQFCRPDMEYRPEVRWWLAEGFHTDRTLLRDIEMIEESGFGAIEFLAMDEPGADSALYGWGSEEWIHDSHVVMEQATKKGMGVSMTSGTNWSNANLISITPDDKAAAKELDYTSEVIQPGCSRSGLLQKCVLTQPCVHRQELLAVLAMKRQGNQIEETGETVLDKDACVLLTNQVKDGTLAFTAPEDGEYELFAFWLHGTGQTASPSVSVSYTINYIDRYGVEAFIDYWDREVITEEMKGFLKENHRVQMYMDSLELSTYGRGGQFWGYHFLEEFEERRGYDLTPYLPFVVKESGGFMVRHRYHYTCGDGIFLEKLRNDLYQTMTDLYMENMLCPMQKWLHGIGMTLRAEISYGLPFEISQPGKYVDGIETESLEFCSQIESYRNLSGASHLYRRLYSSETGASLMNYMNGLEFYTQIIYTQFAAGVARTVLHGYSSIAGSDASTYWPGHEGMWPVFSERFGSRQPAYRHYEDWTTMISRYQLMLRQGRPRVDLGILRLDYQFNNLISWGLDNLTELDYYENKGFRANEGLYWKDMSLQNMGYTYEYFAPQILEEDFVTWENGMLDSEGAGYQALIVYQEALPYAAALKLYRLAQSGMPLLFVNGVNETLRPEGISFTHRQAAMRTASLDQRDEELAALIARIKDLPNVREVQEQTKTLETLQDMGIVPRVAFQEESRSILTNLREDGKGKYLFVYQFMYTKPEPADVTLSVEGTGRPWRLDCWSGEIREIPDYRQHGGRTELELHMLPGEACMIYLENSEEEKHCDIRASKGGLHREYAPLVPEPVRIRQWNLEVEDWNEGRKVTISENRGLGIETREVYYETTKKRIRVEGTDLKPWCEIPQVGPEVSGVGYYTAKVRLSEEWVNTCGTILRLGSTNGNTAAVYVNGKKAGAVDFNVKRIDISRLLVPGENTLCVEVSSTLNNRLLARGYYRKSGLYTLRINDEDAELPEDSPFHIKASVQNYGLTGDAELIPYRYENLE